MALLVSIELGGKTKETHLISSITEAEKKIALIKFQYLKENGCLEGEFEDEIWYINDEMIRVGLNFSFNPFHVKKQKMLSYGEFIDLVKHYICLRFGNDSVHVLARVVTNIKNTVAQTDCFSKFPKNLACLSKEGVEDFIDLLPWQTPNYQIFQETKYLKKRRTLAEYQSYFLLGKIFKQFWATATEQEKNYFYPLHLWWNITMILPLRVTEFLVTPRDCLTKRGNKYYLTIRRTKLKGHKVVEERYRISKDYEKYTYGISDYVAEELKRYMELADQYEESAVDSVFSCDLFKKSKEKLTGRRYTSSGEHKIRHLSVQMMNTLLNDFYDYWILNHLGYKIISKGSLLDVDENGEQYQLTKGEIAYINLGDTRHIALQNLLINGCNLLMAKEISGHETIDMIYHYSGNLKNLVKCYAYRLHSEMKITKYPLDEVSAADRLLEVRSKNYVETDSGKCFSPKMIVDDPSDCFRVSGDCERCIYHDGKSQTKYYESEFLDKVARMKIWLTSKNELKDIEEANVMAKDMKQATENLVVAYCKDLKKEE